MKGGDTKEGATCSPGVGKSLSHVHGDSGDGHPPFGSPSTVRRQPKSKASAPPPPVPEKMKVRDGGRPGRASSGDQRTDQGASKSPSEQPSVEDKKRKKPPLVPDKTKAREILRNSPRHSPRRAPNPPTYTDHQHGHSAHARSHAAMEHYHRDCHSSNGRSHSLSRNGNTKPGDRNGDSKGHRDRRNITNSPKPPPRKTDEKLYSQNNGDNNGGSLRNNKWLLRNGTQSLNNSPKPKKRSPPESQLADDVITANGQPPHANGFPNGKANGLQSREEEPDTHTLKKKDIYGKANTLWLKEQAKKQAKEKKQKDKNNDSEKVGDPNSQPPSAQGSPIKRKCPSPKPTSLNVTPVHSPHNSPPTIRLNTRKKKVLSEVGELVDAANKPPPTYPKPDPRVISARLEQKLLSNQEAVNFHHNLENMEEKNQSQKKAISFDDSKNRNLVKKDHHGNLTMRDSMDVHYGLTIEQAEKLSHGRVSGPAEVTPESTPTACMAAGEAGQTVGIDQKRSAGLTVEQAIKISKSLEALNAVVNENTNPADRDIVREHEEYQGERVYGLTLGQAMKLSKSQELTPMSTDSSSSGAADSKQASLAGPAGRYNDDEDWCQRVMEPQASRERVVADVHSDVNGHNGKAGNQAYNQLLSTDHNANTTNNNLPAVKKHGIRDCGMRSTRLSQGEYSHVQKKRPSSDSVSKHSSPPSLCSPINGHNLSPSRENGNNTAIGKSSLSSKDNKQARSGMQPSRSVHFEEDKSLASEDETIPNDTSVLTLAPRMGAISATVKPGSASPKPVRVVNQRSNIPMGIGVKTNSMERKNKKGGSQQGMTEQDIQAHRYSQASKHGSLDPLYPSVYDNPDLWSLEDRERWRQANGHEFTYLSTHLGKFDGLQVPGMTASGNYSLNDLSMASPYQQGDWSPYRSLSALQVNQLLGKKSCPINGIMQRSYPGCESPTTSSWLINSLPGSDYDNLCDYHGNYHSDTESWDGKRAIGDYDDICKYHERGYSHLDKEAELFSPSKRHPIYGNTNKVLSKEPCYGGSPYRSFNKIKHRGTDSGRGSPSLPTSSNYPRSQFLRRDMNSPVLNGYDTKPLHISEKSPASSSIQPESGQEKDQPGDSLSIDDIAKLPIFQDMQRFLSMYEESGEETDTEVSQLTTKTIKAEVHTKPRSQTSSPGINKARLQPRSTPSPVKAFFAKKDRFEDGEETAEWRVLEDIYHSQQKITKVSWDFFIHNVYSAVPYNMGIFCLKFYSCIRHPLPHLWYGVSLASS